MCAARSEVPVTDRPSLADLERGLPFADRHVGTSPAELAIMLDTIGADSLDALADAVVPAGIRDAAERSSGSEHRHDVRSTLPPAGSETEVLAELRALAAENQIWKSFIGLGYSDCITPPVIQRNILENPGWYTAYTPYQPEISQGRLEALINFQTMVTDLTGLATANASMLDEATAVVEGMLVARRASKSTSNLFLVDADAMPQTRALLAHRAAAVGIELQYTRFAAAEPVEAFGAFVQ